MTFFPFSRILSFILFLLSVSPSTHAFAIATAGPPDRFAFDDHGFIVEILNAQHAGNNFGTSALYVYTASDNRFLGVITLNDFHDPLVAVLPDSTILFCGRTRSREAIDSYLIAYNPLDGFYRSFALHSLPEISCASRQDFEDSSPGRTLQLGWFGNHYGGAVEWTADSSSRLVIIRKWYTGYVRDVSGVLVPFPDNSVEALQIDVRSGEVEHVMGLPVRLSAHAEPNIETPLGLVSVNGRRLPGYPSLTGTAHVRDVRRLSLLIALVGISLLCLASCVRLGRTRFWLAATGLGFLSTFIDPVFIRDLHDLFRGDVTTEFPGFTPRYSYIFPVYASVRPVLENAVVWVAGLLLVATALKRHLERNDKSWFTLIYGAILPFASRTLGLLLQAIPAIIQITMEDLSVDWLWSIPLACLLAWLMDMMGLVSVIYVAIPFGILTATILMLVAMKKAR